MTDSDKNKLTMAITNKYLPSENQPDLRNIFENHEKTFGENFYNKLVNKFPNFETRIIYLVNELFDQQKVNDFITIVRKTYPGFCQDDPNRTDNIRPELDHKIIQEENERTRNSPGLIVKISKKNNKAKNFTVKAWLITDMTAWSKSNLQTSNFKNLMIEKKPQIYIESLEALGQKIPNILDEASYELDRTIDQIHIYLPYQLIHYPFDMFKKKSNSSCRLGQTTKIMVHCLERYELKTRKNSQNINSWKTRSDNIRNYTLINHNFEIFDDNSNLTLEQQIMEYEKKFFVLTKRNFSSPEEPCELFFTHGIPFALWLRQDFFEINSVVDVDIRNILGEILNEGNNYLEKLPEQVRIKRVHATNPKDIGNHLSLLWDDPNLKLPFEQELTDVKLK